MRDDFICARGMAGPARLLYPPASLTVGHDRIADVQTLDELKATSEANQLVGMRLVAGLPQLPQV